MSRTLDILCHTCKESLCIGQERMDGVYKQWHVYTTEKHIKAFNAFINSHVGHDISWIDSESATHLDYYNLNESDE